MNNSHRGFSPGHSDLLGMLETSCTLAVIDGLRTIAAIAEQAGNTAYLVGGAVRDLLLRRTTRDIDIVVEGDAPQVARSFAAQTGERCRVHSEFGTADVSADYGARFDFATARRERYSATGILPEVESSSISEDLGRRDFTINTLAVDLSDFNQLEVTDLFGGVRDLRQGIIRTLHAHSFWDDPTRILRAVRLEQRLGVSMERETLHFARQAIQDEVLREVSGDRLRKEIVLLCSEPGSVVNAIQRLDRLGVLESLVPGFLLSERVKELLQKVQDSVERLTDVPHRVELRFWLVVLMVLSSELEEAGKIRLVDRFAIVGRDRSAFLDVGRRIRQTVEVLESSESSGSKLVSHQASRLLEAFSIEELLLLAAVGGDRVEKWVIREIVEFRRLQLSIRGADLIERGHAPGSALGKALSATRDARLDGRISAESELEFADALLTSRRESK